MRFIYPPVRRSDVVDDYHGRSIADPYRWLEDPTAAETAEFVAAQNAVTMPYLASLPRRDDLRRRMTELWDAPRTRPPTVRNGVAVWAHNDGLANQPTYYVRYGDGAVKTLLDPNSLSDDGAVAVIVTSLSPDGQIFAYSISEAGSDRQIMRLRSTDTGEDLADELRHLRHTSVAWFDDGFFYTRFPETEPGSTAPIGKPSVMFHRVGDAQEDDRLVFENNERPDLGYEPYVTQDGAILTLYEYEGTSHDYGMLALDLRQPDAEWVRLTDVGGIGLHTILLHDDGDLIAHISGDAPNGRIVRIPIDSPADITDVVPHTDQPIEHAAALAGGLVIVRLADASHRIERRDLAGRLIGEIDLPGRGTVGVLTGRFDDPDVYLAYESFLIAPTALRWDGERTTPFDTGLPPSPGATRHDPFHAGRFSVERHHAVSSDGSEVGMFVIGPTDADAPRPVELYGYGGFSINLTPMFTPARLAFLEAGGTVVVANLRGSTINGEEWHRQGMRANKQQVFDDFIACAEHLVDAGITTHAQIGIRGGSNGGLLTTAVMLQRPDLFGAVVSQVPVTDMLRYQHFTAGRFWTVEFGDAADPDAFEWLIAYSPLHNVGDASAYPPLLITTAESDDRVVPMHSHKFAATVQHAARLASEQPLLLRIETRAGHGFGKPTSKLIAESADVYAFFLHHLAG